MMDVHTKRKAGETAEQSASSPARNGTQAPQQAIARDLGERFRDALLARDLQAVYGLVEPEASLHSPIMDWGGYKFDGRDEAIQAVRMFMNEAYELAFTHISASEDACILGFSMRMGGRLMEGMFLVEPGARGLISNIDIFIRGYLSVAVAATRIGPGLVRHHSLWRAGVGFVVTRVLALCVWFVYFLAVKVIVGPSVRALRSRAMSLPVKPR